MKPSVAICPLSESNSAAVAAVGPSWAQVVPSLLTNASSGRSTAFVAFIDDDPVGIVELTVEAVPELRNARVLPEYRGRGIGTQLVQAAEECAQGQGVIGLRVGIDNQGARRLYEKLGYEATGETSTTTYDYVSDDGEWLTATETDAWMIKVLGPAG